MLNTSDQSQVSYKRFIYSGDDVIMTKDTSGTVVEKYILGGGVDNQLAVTTATGTYYFNRDGLGSVVAITDSTGAVVETYEYTTFGLPTIKNASGVIISESTIGNTLMFTGRMWDAELGIYDYRNRVYNPEMGVFYQTDPLGYADSTNMYAYCVNDPVNFVDPFGEKVKNETDEVIWYKDEDDENVYIIAPNSTYYGTHDGIGIPVTGVIYKTHGKTFELFKSIRIRVDADYVVTKDYKILPDGFISKELDSRKGGGKGDAWLKALQRKEDYGWDNLFSKARSLAKDVNAKDSSSVLNKSATNNKEDSAPREKGYDTRGTNDKNGGGC